TRLRGLVNSTFTPRRGVDLEAVVPPPAVPALGGGIPLCEGDPYPVAAPLPLALIRSLLGAPDADHPPALGWANRTFGQEEYSSGSEDTTAAFTDCFAYGLRLAAARRLEPRNDLMSSLAHAEIDGESITDAELATLFFLFLGAGNDTTR